MADSNLAAALDISGPPAGVSDSAPGVSASQPTPPPPIPPEISGAKPSAPEAPVSDPLSLSMQPAQPAAPVNPKFNRTFLSTLKGIALGFMEGNIPGAIQGWH